MDSVTLYATWPDQDSAERAGRTLIEQRLAACVNLIPNVTSLYRWDGAIQRDSEILMLVKTSAERALSARDALLAAHPYDLPCITAFRIDSAHASADFLNWLQEQTR